MSRIKTALENLWYSIRLGMMNYPYSKKWDKIVNELIDGNAEIKHSYLGYSAVIGTYNVWLSNYPYSYGRPYNNMGIPDDIRPSRKTILKLKNYIDSKDEKRQLRKQWIQ